MEGDVVDGILAVVEEMEAKDKEDKVGGKIDRQPVGTAVGKATHLGTALSLKLMQPRVFRRPRKSKPLLGPKRACDPQ